jgi:predicted MFS family arabinose efflux permease
MEARKYSSASWMMSLAVGSLNLGIALGAVVCAVVLRSITALAYLYFVGLLYSAMIRIASAFRRTEIVYIQ